MLLLLFIVVVVANVVVFVAFIVIGLLYGLVNRDLWLECVLVDGFSVTEKGERAPNSVTEY